MRRRAPQNDYICLRCGCACTPDGSRHLGGGQGMRSCGKTPKPVLRRDLEAEAEQVVRQVRAGAKGTNRAD